MGELAKPLYIMVVEEMERRENQASRYTRSTLQSTLQLMGCKPRHAFKISQRVFELIKGESSAEILLQDRIPSTGLYALGGSATKESGTQANGFPDKVEVGSFDKDEKDRNMPFELYKRRTTVFVRRETFLDVVCNALSEYKYVGPNQRDDLILACRIRERKESVTVLLCGTSGCGKSTLSSLLASRLGITTVISTDSIRHMMRSFVDEKQNPLLWASTYHAGEYLDTEAVAEARAKRKAKKLAGITTPDDSNADRSDGPLVSSNRTNLISPKQLAIEGFKAQSEMVIDSLDRLITAWEEQKESVVVEGVHLSLNFVMGLMKKHPTIIPFMVYISNEEKHLERFAVRAKYMTLDPEKNKYVKYIRNIRTIQEYLCKRADKHLVPKINNTNVDKSVAAIHATVFSCLRRHEEGDQLYDAIRNKVTVIDEVYRNKCAANSLSSKGMFQLIQRKGSSRHLMALVNNDGSVAKAWPVDAASRTKKRLGQESDNGIYGPLQIGKAEPVNLQFGHFGISAWPIDGGTSNSGSYAGSFDETRTDWAELSSRHHSSSCSSPRALEGPSKELKEDNSEHGSDEEVDDPPEAESDFSDAGDRDDEEEVGSVDEESNKSDEEYDDLAMLDIQDMGYWSDEEESRYKVSPLHIHPGKHSQNLSRFLRSKSERSPAEEPAYPYSLLPGSLKLKRRALSNPALSKHGSFSGPIFSGASRR